MSKSKNNSKNYNIKFGINRNQFTVENISTRSCIIIIKQVLLRGNGKRSNRIKNLNLSNLLI